MSKKNRQNTTEHMLMFLFSFFTLRLVLWLWFELWFTSTHQEPIPQCETVSTEMRHCGCK